MYIDSRIVCITENISKYNQKFCLSCLFGLAHSLKKGFSIECLFFGCHRSYNTPRRCRQIEYRTLVASEASSNDKACVNRNV